jgi:hypothetical protein
MREVRRAHERFVADHLHRGGKQRLAAFAADEDSARFHLPDDVLAEFLAGL